MIDLPIHKDFQPNLFWHAMRAIARIMISKDMRRRSARRLNLHWDLVTALAPQSFTSEQTDKVGCRPDYAIRVIAADLEMLPASADVMPVTLMHAWYLELIDKHGSLTTALGVLLRVAVEACQKLAVTQPRARPRRTPHKFRYAAAMAMHHPKTDEALYLGGG